MGTALRSLRLAGSHGTGADAARSTGDASQQRMDAVRDESAERRGKKSSSVSVRGKDGWMRLSRDGVCGAVERHCWPERSVSLSGFTAFILNITLYKTG